MWSFLCRACVFVWSLCAPCNRLIRTLWGQRSTGAEEERPSPLEVELWRELSQHDTHTFTVSSTWIYAVIPPPLSPPVTFSSRTFFSHNSLFIFYFFTLPCGYRLGSRVDPSLQCLKKKGMFLGHGNALKDLWDSTSGPQWTCCSVEISEVMIIFYFLLELSAHCCTVSAYNFPENACQSHCVDLCILNL